MEVGRILAISGPEVARLPLARPTRLSHGIPGTHLSSVCSPSNTSNDLIGKFSFSKAPQISLLRTSFFTFTLVERFDVFSQCCLANEANSLSHSKSSAVGRSEPAWDRDSAPLLSLFAVGMAAMVLTRMTSLVSLLHQQGERVKLQIFMKLEVWLALCGLLCVAGGDQSFANQIATAAQPCRKPPNAIRFY